MRHRWNQKVKSKALDSSSVCCIKCGMVRQYIGGYPTYFLNDNVFDKKAPKCEPKIDKP